MTEPFIKCAMVGNIVTLTMNRPESRNSLSTHEECADFVASIQRASEDPSVSCVILTGAGKSFSAGGNLKAMKERNGIGPLATPDATRANYKRGVQAIAKALWECEVPMIAAINGHAIGLGLDLACLCDIRLAADTAKLGSTFVKMGIVPGDGGAWILPRAVSLSKASEMIFTGEILDAATALRVGLVSRICPADTLMSEAQSLASAITANPARALRLAKRLIREGQHGRFNDILELSASFQALAHETEDHAEAVNAFLEKRDPQFTGR